MPDATLPYAYLKAITPEAVASAGNRVKVPVYTFPFRVGRDSRNTSARLIDKDRRGPRSAPNNDLYLRDPNEAVFISREHFQIEQRGDGFVIIDRQSVLGTTVEGVHIGGDRRGGEAPLQNQDVIIVGDHEGGYIFKFLVE